MVDVEQYAFAQPIKHIVKQSSVVDFKDACIDRARKSEYSERRIITNKGHPSITLFKTLHPLSHF